METLRSVYIALAVLGLGATLVDLFGAFGHASARDRTRLAASLVSLLRTVAHFALGAGCAGLAALLMGRGAGSSLAWAFGAGAAIALVARLLRGSLRRDLDSSFSPEDFILEEATVVVPIAPGLMGKAEVRKYGAASSIYARAEDPAQAFERGAKVRIIDYRDGSYLVEPADEEHLVH